MSWSEAVRVPLRTLRRGWLTAWDLGVLACANAAVIAGLWWRAGGAGDVHGVADALTSAGRLLGLLGAYFLTRNRWWEAHPFSLSAAPDGRTLRITVKALGDFSARLAAIAPGTRVIADGPYGAFTETARKRRRVAYIAGGVGITPVRALLEAARGDIVVVHRIAASGDAIFRGELRRLVAERGARLHYVVGDHRDPAARHLLRPLHLRALVPDIAERDVYVCGPEGMVDATLDSRREAGVPRPHVHAERFAF